MSPSNLRFLRCQCCGFRASARSHVAVVEALVDHAGVCRPMRERRALDGLVGRHEPLEARAE